MSLLGLIRHLSEVERVYGYFALSGAALELRYCGDNPEGDFENLTAEDVRPSIQAWHHDCRASDAVIADTSLDGTRPGNGLTVRWNLMKLVGEYARHAGHADLLRERNRRSRWRVSLLSASTGYVIQGAKATSGTAIFGHTRLGANILTL